MARHPGHRAAEVCDAMFTAIVLEARVQVHEYTTDGSCDVAAGWPTLEWTRRLVADLLPLQLLDEEG